MNVSIMEDTVNDPREQSSLLVFDDTSFLELLQDATDNPSEDVMSLGYENLASPMSSEEESLPPTTPTGSDILSDDGDENWVDADGSDVEASHSLQEVYVYIFV